MPPKRRWDEACEKINMIAAQCKADAPRPGHGFSVAEWLPVEALNASRAHIENRPKTASGIPRLV